MTYDMTKDGSNTHKCPYIWRVEGQLARTHSTSGYETSTSVAMQSTNKCCEVPAYVSVLNANNCAPK